MKTVKKLFALLLVLALCLSLGSAVLAAPADDPAKAAADHLYSLGLFRGTGTDSAGNPIYELDRAPSRAEAVTMLVRLLGKDAAAQSGSWTIPFTDVPDWAVPYVGYAYANKLTNGVSATEFGSTATASATMYITFVLRALGYSDAAGDFAWDKAWELSDSLGITDGSYNAANNAAFTRGGVAIVSNNALDANYKGVKTTLLQRLRAEGAVTVGAAPSYSFELDGKYVRANESEVYDNALGEYATLLSKAEQDGLSQDERFVRMAQAEAALLDSAAVLPTTFSPNAGTTTYFAGLNLDRGAFALENGAAASGKTEEQKISTATAMQNKAFRQALQFAFDRGTFNAASRGEDQKYANLRNMLCPPDFVSLSANVTVDGVSFEAGTLYGAMVQYYLNQRNSPITVADGQDGWYRPDEAKARLEQAKAELGDSVSWPVVIDVVYYSQSSAQLAQAQAYKQSLEGCLGSANIRVNLISTDNANDYYSCGYSAASGEACNFDMFYGSGWGADYDDPSTFLDIFLGGGFGYMTRILGLF